MQPYKAKIIRSSKEIKSKKTRQKRPRNRIRRKIAKSGLKSQVVALPQLKLTSLRPKKVKRRSDAITKVLKKTFLKLPVTIVIRKVTILGIASSQKN